MFTFSKKSRVKLDTCHPDLVQVAELALTLSPVDITIVWGFRNEDQQNAMVDSGVSKTPWPTSKHNHMEGDQRMSLAIDFAPWVAGKIPWNDTHLFSVVAGVVFAAASQIGVSLRWGGDFNMNGLTTDQTFLDFGHIELHE